MSKQKLLILKTLCKLDRDDVRATAYDSKLANRFYDVKTIAKYIYGETVFSPDDKLKIATRTSLNRMLQSLLTDGYVNSPGRRYFGPNSLRMGSGNREYQKNHWLVTSAGKKVLAACCNGELRMYLASHRYVGENGAFAVSEVVKAPNDGK